MTMYTVLLKDTSETMNYVLWKPKPCRQGSYNAQLLKWESALCDCLSQPETRTHLIQYSAALWKAIWRTWCLTSGFREWLHSRYFVASCSATLCLLPSQAGNCSNCACARPCTGHLRDSISGRAPVPLRFGGRISPAWWVCVPVCSSYGAIDWGVGGGIMSAY